MLLGANYTVGNFGVGGSTASLDSENPYMNESAFQDAKEFQPNIVIIMLGTNDANPLIRPNNGSFVDDYVKLVEEFQALSSKPQDIPCEAATDFSAMEQLQALNISGTTLFPLLNR